MGGSVAEVAHHPPPDLHGHQRAHPPPGSAPGGVGTQCPGPGGLDPALTGAPPWHPPMEHDLEQVANHFYLSRMRFIKDARAEIPEC
eukprot:15159188-Alexandrium_andersonii.AAC.1